MLVIERSEKAQLVGAAASTKTSVAVLAVTLTEDVTITSQIQNVA